MNTNEKDGGPAYPAHGWSSNPEVLDRMKDQGGMTLRQYYKAAALPYGGKLVIEMARNGSVTKDTPGQIAFFAAEVADAMLAEDEKHEKKHS